jgi:hypothetical protein
MTKPFSDLTKHDLWTLRQQIVLGSLYTADYRNDLGYDEHKVCDFFDGYVSFLQDLADEYGSPWAALDSPEHLQEWFLCFDDFSWIE